jgi:hypothetical protein
MLAKYRTAPSAEEIEEIQRDMFSGFALGTRTIEVA